MTPRIHCRWILNAVPEPERAAKQLDGFKADGFDGVLLDEESGPLPAATLAAITAHATSIGLAVLMRTDADRDMPDAVEVVGDAQWSVAKPVPDVEHDLARCQARQAVAGGGRLVMAQPAPTTWTDTPATMLTPVRRGGRSGVTDWIVGGQVYAFDGRRVSGPGHYGWREALPAVLALLRRDATEHVAADAAPVLLMAGEAATPEACDNMHRRLRAVGDPVHLPAPADLAAARADGDAMVIGAARYGHVATVRDDSLGDHLRSVLADFTGTWTRSPEDLPEPAKALASTTSERFTDIAIRWDDVEPEVNALPLILSRAGDAWHTGFGMDELIDGSLVFMEPCRDLRVNGEAVEIESIGPVQVAVLAAEILAPENLLEFSTVHPKPAGDAAAGAPFVSLIGDFRVMHETHDDGRIDPARPILTEPAPLPDGDLAAGGYPYLHRPATVAGTFYLKQTQRVDSVQLLLPEAAALRLAIDGEDYGWIWGPDWRVAGQRLAPGVHDIEISLAPLAAQYYAPALVAGGPLGLPAFALPATIRLHPVKDGD